MKNSFLFVGLLLFLSTLGISQNRLRFDRLSVREGLSHTTVHVIFQDDKGLIWIGTEDGLNIYNGYEIEVFKHHRNIRNSISNNVIKDIFQDSKGVVWVATEKGLNRYVPKNNDFVHYFVNEKEPSKGLTHNHIRKILEDKHGRIWVATDNGLTKIISYDDETLSCVQYPHIIGDATTLAHPKVRGFFKDSKDRLWVGTDGGGMYKVIDSSLGGTATKSEKFIHYSPSAETNFPIRVNSFSEDIYGNIWIGSWCEGLFRMSIDAQGKEILTNFKHKPDGANSINSDKIVNLFADKKGNVWVGTYNMGVNRLIINEKNEVAAIESYLHDPDYEESLSHNTAYNFLEDRAGDIWIGTWGDGISKINAGSNHFLLFGHQTGFSQSIFKETWAAAIDNQENWWVGAWDGGVGRIKNKKDGQVLTYEKDIEVFRHNPSDSTSISNDKVTAILHDSKDRLWITTWSDKVNIVENASTVKTPVFKKINVVGNTYFAYEDKKGTVWIGSQEGLHRLEGAQKKSFIEQEMPIITYKQEKNNPSSLPDNRVRSMLEDKEGYIWLGTVGGGVARARRSTFDEIQAPEAMIFELFKYHETDTTSLSCNSVGCIFQDSKGTIWLGTKEGLNRFERKTNTFRHYNEQTGHFKNNVINGIVEDENGLLWIGTERGITKFDPVSEESIHYDKKDGLQGKVFSSTAIIKAKKDYFLFGGGEGLNAFSPRSITKNSYLPPVILTDIKIFNQSIAKNHSCLNNVAFREVKEILLQHYENILTFEFAALNFSVPEHNLYQYKLDGFDEKWHHIHHKRTVTFTNLEPGEYTLLVKGSNNDGIWNKEPLALKIIVFPPFWQTWWFRFLIGLLILLVIYAYLRYRIRATESENKRLEKMVQERTTEIEKQKQLVEERSQYKEQFFSNVSHELRTPLNGIIGMSHLLLRTELTEAQSQFANVVQDSAENLLVIINDLLDVSKINAGKMELVSRPFETNRFFNSLYELLRPKAEQKNLELTFEITDEMPKYLTGDSVRLYQVLINLLGNALKFTIEGSITLVVEIEEKEGDEVVLDFEIIDTGIGIPKEKLGNIFKEYSQVLDKEGYHYEGSGLGLTIVKNLVELQNGTIAVESEYNEGTVFSVALRFGIPKDEDILAEGTARKEREFSRKWKDKEVLMIEDNPVNLLYAKNLFLQWNLGVAVAKNIKEAIRLLALNRYDVIISDVKLPDGNGLDLIRGIQKNKNHRNSETPVIVLSASASLNGKRPDDINIVTYLIKPFLPERLAETLDNIFGESIGAPSAAIDDMIEPKAGNVYALAHLHQMMRGNPKHMVAMLDVFLKQLPECLNKMEKYINAENWEKLNYEAHTIKSTIRTIGITELAVMAQNIENTTEEAELNLVLILEQFEMFRQRSLSEIPQLQEERDRLMAQ